MKIKIWGVLFAFILSLDAKELKPGKNIKTNGQIHKISIAYKYLVKRDPVLESLCRSERIFDRGGNLVSYKDFTCPNTPSSETVSEFDKRNRIISVRHADIEEGTEFKRKYLYLDDNTSVELQSSGKNKISTITITKEDKLLKKIESWDLSLENDFGDKTVIDRGTDFSEKLIKCRMNFRTGECRETHNSQTFDNGTLLIHKKDKATTRTETQKIDAYNKKALKFENEKLIETLEQKFNDSGLKTSEFKLNNQGKIVSKTYFKYNDYGQKIEEVEITIGSNKESKSVFEYDQRGNVVSEKLFENGILLTSIKSEIQYFE